MQPAYNQRTNLFTVRVWGERVSREERIIRIKVQHVLSGEVRYFRNWSDVLVFVMSIVATDGGDTANCID